MKDKTAKIEYAEQCLTTLRLELKVRPFCIHMHVHFFTLSLDACSEYRSYLKKIDVFQLCHAVSI